MLLDYLYTVFDLLWEVIPKASPTSVPHTPTCSVLSSSRDSTHQPIFPSSAQMKILLTMFNGKRNGTFSSTGESKISTGAIQHFKRLILSDYPCLEAPSGRCWYCFPHCNRIGKSTTWPLPGWMGKHRQSDKISRLKCCMAPVDIFDSPVEEKNRSRNLNESTITFFH